MNFNYTLTSEECLEFIKENIPKTKYFLIELIAHIVTFLLLLLLSYTLFKERLLSFSIIAIFIFIVILFLKKIVISSHCRRFKISPQNSSFITSKNISLEIISTDKIDTNILNLKTNYESISIPFTKIDSIFISSKYIFISSSISKNILIPTTEFKSEQQQNTFLNSFNKSMLTKNFPSNYKFF
ncbi:MAG: hypothetical protein ACRC1T_03620 [Clostridium chrysemydis]|uniref:hypothetical protein n=1 Tax=Clostridium chrysemydis TaxID=2665504 RepID=UPI003F3EEECA